jgi:hypothetical protein
MGYDLDELLEDLERLPTTTAALGPDLAQLANDVVREPWRLRMRRRGVGGPNALRELLRS